MNKFRVGDIIRGINVSYYSITNADMTRGLVTRVIPGGNEIEVKVLEHKYSENIGLKFIVGSYYFELVKAGENNYKDEMMYIIEYKTANGVSRSKLAKKRNENFPSHKDCLKFVMSIVDKKEFKDYPVCITNIKVKKLDMEQLVYDNVYYFGGF